MAIKIVESVVGNMEQDDENARESLVAASMSHPNVVRRNANHPLIWGSTGRSGFKGLGFSVGATRHLVESVTRTPMPAGAHRKQTLCTTST